MVNFAGQTLCRRKTILKYFSENFSAAENFDPKKCCDNCADPPENFDATEISQKIFSAIFRTGQKFGAGMIADFLTGSQNQKIKNFRLEKIQTFGICREFSAKNLREILGELLSREFLKISDPQFPILKLTEKAAAVLKNSKKVFLPKIKKSAAAVEKFSPTGNFDAELFEILRAKRLQLSRAENVAPFVIFGDKSLYEMAEFLPRNSADFLRISGVGAMKLEKFGADFLREIAEFSGENFDEENFQKEISAQNSPENFLEIPPPNDRSFEILKFFAAGKSPEKIAENLGVKIGTVFSHFEKLAAAGKLENLNLESLIAPQNLEILTNFWRENSRASLREARENLGENFSWGELRLARALQKSRD